LQDAFNLVSGSQFRYVIDNSLVLHVGVILLVTYITTVDFDFEFDMYPTSPIYSEIHSLDYSMGSEASASV